MVVVQNSGMPHDSWRHTESVTVPSVLGLHIRDAEQVAYQAGLKLAQPDPDGPPLAALTWPDDYWITGQTPPAGTKLWRWDPLVVDWSPVPGGDGPNVREPLRPTPTPRLLTGAAQPDNDTAGLPPRST